MRICLGARRSALSLAQVELVRGQLRVTHPGLELDVRPLASQGDLAREVLANSQSLLGTKVVSDKCEWIAGLEEKLVSGEVDLLIHSAKDVPIEVARGTAVQPILAREEPFDIFISHPLLRGVPLVEVPPGSTVATSSLRRRAQLKVAYPQLRTVAISGNIDTRLRKLAATDPNDLAGIVLAQSGIRRLGLEVAGEVLRPPLFIPAAHQGTLLAQWLQSRTDIEDVVKSLQIPTTVNCWLAERRVVELLGVDCNSAVGIFAEQLPPATNDSTQSKLRILVKMIDLDCKKNTEGQNHEWTGFLEQWKEGAQSVCQGVTSHTPPTSSS